MAYRRIFRLLLLAAGLSVAALTLAAETSKNWAYEPPAYAPTLEPRVEASGRAGGEDVSSAAARGEPLRMTNLTQRPIFHADRRPYRPEVKVAKKVEQRPERPRLEDVSVQGILLSDEITIAKIVTKKHPEGMWLPVNGKVDGVVVIDIQFNSVTLMSGAERKKINIALHGGGVDER